MKTRIFTLLFFLIHSVTLSAQNSDSNNGETKIPFLILEEETELPLPGVQVSILNIGGNVTNEYGEATVSFESQRRTFDILIKKQNYEPLYERIDFDELLPEKFKFYLKPKVDFYELRVKVTDDKINTSEQVILNSTITIHKEGKTSITKEAEFGWATFTNIESDESFLIEVEHNEFETGFIAVPENDENKKQVEVTVKLVRDHFPVHVKVISNGKPVNRATVSFVGLTGKNSKSTTNREGVAEFKAIEKGLQQIEVSKRGYMIIDTTFTVTEKNYPKINEFSYSISKPDSLLVTGRIVEEGTKKGLSRAAVYLYGDPSVNMMTDEKGYFKLSKKIAYSDLTDQSFYLTVKHSYYKKFHTEELKLLYSEYLKNNKDVTIIAQRKNLEWVEVKIELNKRVADEKYIIDCTYRNKEKEKTPRKPKLIPDKGNDKYYLVLIAPIDWIDVGLRICTPNHYFEDIIEKKKILKKTKASNKEYYLLKMKKNRGGRKCNPD